VPSVCCGSSTDPQGEIGLREESEVCSAVVLIVRQVLFLIAGLSDRIRPLIRAWQSV